MKVTQGLGERVGDAASAEAVCMVLSNGSGSGNW